jgi:hypothetical protein
MPNGNFDLRQSLRESLVDTLQTEFREIQLLRAWMQNHFRYDLPDNILKNPGLKSQVNDVLDWAESNGYRLELLQSLYDNCPGTQKVRLRALIGLISQNQIVESTSALLDPSESCMLGMRAFVNRASFRQALKTFDAAHSDADSVLIIEGASPSGKTHGLRLAKACVPPHRRISIDIKVDFGEGLVNAGDLAEAIYGSGSQIQPKFDPTKEDAEVPRLYQWLLSKFSTLGEILWIIIDHCDRPNLTTPARELLIKLATKIDNSDLPNLRLILVGFARTTLPGGLSWASRHDKAELPSAAELRAWFQEVAAIKKKLVVAADIDGYLAEVFAGHPNPTQALIDSQYERRLYDVYNKL